eukprot:TRINITY_DN1611_c0_g1_i4.p1 TRINITY_DN1611_c0_g1~~TRINITY_DN1611_c0_g1_i4.p1  ORF type:complete len:544 (-),score=95.50 TRINITY_DN1611_c0_g1_i4:818-2449(-)
MSLVQRAFKIPRSVTSLVRIERLRSPTASIACKSYYSTKPDTCAYEEAYRDSITNPSEFWGKEASKLHWFKKWTKVFDDSDKPSSCWFQGGQTNICYNAIDKHIESNNRGNDLALIYESPVTSKSQTYTYNELQKKVSNAARVLLNLGVKKGDFVMVYMPMIPEAMFTMLAAARIGAPHVVVFGGFSANELAVRMESTKPKIIVSASCGYERAGKPIEYKPLVDKAIELSSHKPEKVIVLQREGLISQMSSSRDVDYAELHSGHHDFVPCAHLESSHPLYVIHTSGSTGVPKGILRDHGGYMTALRWSMESIYGMNPGDRFWAASDIGWVVGHSYIVYGPLLNGCTSFLYEGKPVGTPDAGAYWNLIQKHRINAMFTAPTALRAIKKDDYEGVHVKKYDLSSLRALFLAGEHADPNSVAWIQRILNKPIIDHWWQTESGWPMASNFLGLTTFETKLGSVTKAVPGFDIKILDPKTMQEMPRGSMGSIYVKYPLPPGAFATLWGKDGPDAVQYQRSYFAETNDYYTTGDAGLMDKVFSICSHYS